jgi:hypothetical protein
MNKPTSYLTSLAAQSYVVSLSFLQPLGNPYLPPASVTKTLVHL